ncbi:PRTRC system ParB family protein [Acidithiobacillus caldus]|uniref:ParB-like N-terminal domain-containing protein n=1 Tax=Acidithiobacillus caldus TaxID=33059 RepID=A0A1E7YN96_9PROT|nr:PRTRC system ParB family protein [Acidithiobacillus caldus]OFC35520.1 hypothetical protein BAE29_15315 [Acidithiobacillus caldus]OFC36369.1 hypothetical protein BAE27_06215 [Acidithiobacillus caldus]OFC40435.1 hypothetical protein BAE28_00035 [Acidithiobacillus caldus]OFC62428.1 hypothetical protein BAE30_01970 [Acidithiobacillus caldus]
MQVQISQIQPGNNPRKYMDPGELEELTSSVRSLGILQPIVVKKAEGERFSIVAGHRRFAAAQAAGLTEVPVHIVDEDIDGDAAALAENVIRADMSPAEECNAAIHLLKRNHGDIEEVCLLLGWTRDKLTRRVALSSCSVKVREALARREIKLGIAELLASVPEQANQDKALEKIIANDLSVAEVRAFLSKLTQKLEKAIFDKTECQTCRFNTALQATLFSEVVAEDAYCTNGECFARKTEAAVRAKADTIRDDFPMVRMVGISDPETYTKLLADGSHGVGAQQCTACKQCANYGAIVWNTPGHEGEIEADICFDLDCHEKMVAAAQPVASVTTSAAATGIDPEPGDSEPLDDERESGEDPEPDATASEAGSCCGGTTAPHTGMLTNAVREYRRSVWNQAAIMTLVQNPEKGHILLLVLLSKGWNTDRLAIAETLHKYGVTGGSLDTMCATFETAEAKRKIPNLTAAAAASAVVLMSEAQVQETLRYLHPDLSEHWQINADYLKLLTKSQIEAVCEELGLRDTLPAKVFSGKKDQIISGILNAGVDFTGLVPQHMQY